MGNQERRGRPAGGWPKPAVDDDFPVLVRVSLAASKREGRPFDSAWQEATTRIKPRDPIWLLDDGELEPPLAFLRRHMRAAYHGRVGQRHCQVPGCAQLAHVGTRCARHLRVAPSAIVAGDDEGGENGAGL